MKGFTTKAIHGAPVKKDAHGTLRMPVYDSVAFEHETAETMQAAFEGRLPAHSYSRISNPTVEDYEQRVRVLADALGVIAVSSGMAAISNVILALAEAGTNIVTTRSLFGNTYSLFENTLRPWGLDINYVDLSSPDALGHRHRREYSRRFSGNHYQPSASSFRRSRRWRRSPMPMTYP